MPDFAVARTEMMHDCDLVVVTGVDNPTRAMFNCWAEVTGEAELEAEVKTAAASGCVEVRLPVTTNGLETWNKEVRRRRELDIVQHVSWTRWHSLALAAAAVLATGSLAAAAFPRVVVDMFM